MENAEEIFHFLEDFSKRKPKTIPQELNDYLAYVARTGDPVYQWSVVKCLFKEKLLNVITDFYEPTSSIDIPPYPNVDPFNYDTLKNSLIERLDSFTSAPFTVQRICELLTFPRKQYNRVDKYMRAIEKNILVVSTREPGTHRHAEAENGEPIVNGSDNNSEYNVDVEMEDMSWKETKEPSQNSEPQPSSSESYSIAEIEVRLRAKQGFPPVSEDKPTDAFTPTDQTDQITDKHIESEEKISNFASEAVPSTSDNQKVDTESVPDTTDKMDMDEKAEESSSQAMVIPEIKINDTSIDEKDIEPNQGEDKEPEQKIAENTSVLEELPSNEPDTEIKTKEIEIETKMISEVTEMSSSSEESSSSSDNTDGNSNSPKAVPEDHMDEREIDKVETDHTESTVEAKTVSEVPEKSPPPVVMQSDNYSITDVNSELPQITASSDSKPEEPLEEKMDADDKDSEEQKTENETETEVETATKTDNNEATTPV